MKYAVPRIALIIAGGRGVRLRPLTYKIPKPLVPINGKPVIGHIIDELVRNGIRDIVVSIGYKSRMIMKYLDNAGFDARISYVVEKEPLGTGGGLKLSLKKIRSRYDGDIFFVYGDAVFRFDISKEYRLHREKKALITMAVKRKPVVTGRGVAFLNGTRVIRFIEKPDQNSAPEDRSNLTNAGKYILNMKVLDLLPKKRSFSFEEDFLQNSVSGMNVQGYLTKVRSFSIDTPEKLKLAREKWRT